MDRKRLTAALIAARFHDWFDGYESPSEMADLIAIHYANAGTERVPLDPPLDDFYLIRPKED